MTAIGYIFSGVMVAQLASKVLLRGAGQGIARGAKRLRDLGARLLQRTRFEGFRIRIRGAIDTTRREAWPECSEILHITVEGSNHDAEFSAQSVCVSRPPLS